MNIDDRPTDLRAHSHILQNISNRHNSAVHHPTPSCLVLRWDVPDGKSNGTISGWIKFKMAAGGHLGKVQTAISQRRVMRSTSCLVLGWGFRGWRIIQFTVCMYADRTLPSVSNL